jgi:hypothetical protein
MPPAAAVAGAGVAAQVGSGLFGKSSANTAAKIQSGAAYQASQKLGAATTAANGVLGDAYRTAVGQLQPYETAGGNALNQLQWGLGQDSNVYNPNAAPAKTQADYVAELTHQFTTKGALNKYGDLLTGAHDTVDTAGLNAAVQSAMASDAQQAAAQTVQYQGTGAQGALLKPFSQADFTADPGYQFALDQGNRGVQNTAAAGGSLLSGATLKALTRFNQDTASNQYTNSYNRYNQNQQNQLGSLFKLAGMGQNSASQVGQYAQNYGTNVANNIMGTGTGQANLQTQAGNAQAAGVVGGANALTQGVGGAINNLSSFGAMQMNGGANRGSSYGDIYNQPYQQSYGSPFGSNSFNPRAYSY